MRSPLAAALKVHQLLVFFICATIFFCGGIQGQACCINGGCQKVGAGGQSGTDYAARTPGPINPVSGLKPCLLNSAKFPCSAAQKAAATGCVLCCCQVQASAGDTYDKFAARSSKFSSGAAVKSWNGGRALTPGQWYQIC